VRYRIVSSIVNRQSSIAIVPVPDLEQPRLPLPLRLLDAWGDLWVRAFALIGGVSYLMRDVIVWTLRAIFQRRVRFGRTALISQLVRIGVRAIGIEMLVCACIGFILALQMEPPLADFGQQDKIANIVGVAVFRELGPLIAAIVLTGFAGASIAAEIGTMVVGEEIEALEAHALNPVRFLVMPRVIATVISLICLTIIGDLTAVFFAGVMSVSFLDVPYELYKQNTLSQLIASDFYTGLIKAAVFGLILSAIACHNGLKVTGGAAGVGKATTDTVVQTVVSVIIADLVFTTIFFKIGWT
jgi:phospholipid/cholesterol/gamma-HCH transport system permease protein